MRSLAFQLEMRNEIQHPIKIESKPAGKEWFRGFRNRPPKLSFCTPEANAQAFNRHNVEEFFKVLEDATCPGKVTPSHIFNEHETSIVTESIKLIMLVVRLDVSQF